MGRTGERITYAELDGASIRLAQLLYADGLRPGDSIALLAENHPRYFEVYWAALRSGLYLTTVNSHLSAEEAAYLIDDSGSQALVTTSQLGATALSVLPHIPNCRRRLMMDGVLPGFESYEQSTLGFSTTPLADQPRGEVLMYSSGTTGRPKGIRRNLSGKQIDDPEAAGTSRLGRHLLGMNEESVYLCPAPLYHGAALQWSAGVHEMGGTVVVMEKFEPTEYLSLIERERVTHSQVVPTMMVRLLKLPEKVRKSYDVSSLECLLHAAAPCPPEIKRQMIDWLGPIICEYYTGTEGSGMTFLNSAEWLAHPGSVGRPILGTPHICNDDGGELPIGAVGAVYFEQERAPFEYLGDAEKTRDSRHPAHDNWTTLGDIGYLDVDGYLYLTDRRAFTIISGGVNIYPAEIESCLVLHPKVADVAVFGLPDPEWGEFVQAVVQPAAGVEPSDQLSNELRTYAQERLAAYKVPRLIDFRDDLPRLPTGKLSKRHLRDEYLLAPPR
jgi:long-chain acyl-CoA synthetase